MYNSSIKFVLEILLLISVGNLKFSLGFDMTGTLHPPHIYHIQLESLKIELGCPMKLIQMRSDNCPVRKTSTVKTDY